MAPARSHDRNDSPEAFEGFAAVALIEQGLQIRELDRLADALAPDDAGFKYRLIPKATYNRRRKMQRLNPAESDQVLRIARLWAFARTVWGSEAEARDFMFRPHLMLQDRRPIDLAISSGQGARLVENVLGGLAYGTAA